jgi:RNA polymerase sigma-70 factor (ECF subfamily)
MDDQTLIKQLNEGNAKAFEAFVLEYQGLVYNTCYSFLNHREDAEDVAQDVFIYAFKSINSFRGEASLSTWLYKLSMNKSFDFIRARKRQKRGSGLLSSMDNEEMSRLNVSDTNQPHTQLEDGEKRQILHAAIDKLPDRQKRAIILSRFEGLSQEQVAEVMETSVSSVESLLVRGKKKLRELLLDYFYGKDNN